MKNPFEGTLMPSHSDGAVLIYSSSMLKVFQSTMILLKSNCSRINSVKNSFSKDAVLDAISESAEIAKLNFNPFPTTFGIDPSSVKLMESN